MPRPASLPLVMRYSAFMPRSSSAAFKKIIMPPLWPTSAMGPSRSSSGRSSLSVTKRVLGADIAHAIGAGHRKPGLGDHRFKLAAERSGVACCRPRRSLRKTPWRCARRPRRRCATPPARRAPAPARRDGRAAPAAIEVGITAVAGDFGAARIDQIKRPRKFVLLEIAQDAPRPASRPVVGADQHRVARLGERFDFFLRASRSNASRSTWHSPVTRGRRTRWSAGR